MISLPFVFGDPVVGVAMQGETEHSSNRRCRHGSTLFVACSSPGARRGTASPQGDEARTQERSGTEVLVAVVEESAGRVTLLSERPAPERCDRDQLVPGCWFGPLGRSRSYRVPSGPHNAAGRGDVVLVTHPSGGRLTRINVGTGDVRSVALRTEPHDVKFSRDGQTAIVADEDGRRLHIVDPESLETTSSITMPGRAHDLIVDGEDLWVTLVGRSELARVRDSEVELFQTGMRHDLVMDSEGRIWFSNWDSPTLGTFDPATSQTTQAPSGVDEPHHFALGPDGTVWVSDNGDSTVVGFRPDGDVVRVEVGPVPHHLAFAGDRLVVAVSEAGEAAVVEGDRVVGRIRLSPGLHGVAIAETPA